MDLADLAGWIAPAATIVAAMMTASNLGARVTGWGFAVFAVGSISWCVVAVATDQTNLLWTNAFLLLVNVVGVWRWLGRVARYEKGGKAATEHSEAAACAPLMPMSKLLHLSVTGPEDGRTAVIVDAMVRCDNLRPAYFVVSDGGVAGVGEKLHALRPDEIELDGKGAHTRLRSEDIARREALEPETWPVDLTPAQTGLSEASATRPTPAAAI
ncbi:MAG: PRC-barrel domain containing protein [Pseudomonadota bacterium]